MLPFVLLSYLLATFTTLVSTESVPTVTLASGVLKGTTTALPSATAVVNKFLGIPFAASPPKRFAPPTEPAGWKAPLNVSAFKPACIQQFNFPEATREFTMEVFNNPGGPPPAESEDCLYLNVFAPSTPPPPGGRTVMFWLYGGGLQFGDAGLLGYDGSSFAAYQDVIIVTTNYRTNVFGFPNAPSIPLTSRNPGFLDQRFALAWVQNNIHQFGGSPDKVTIFGESAGASSVDKLITTFPHNAPFRAAIMESGEASVAQAPANDGAVGLASWNTLVASLNCSSGAQELECVREAPATTIKSIIEQAALSFPPVTDNLTQISDPATARAERRIATVPVLMGTNAQEGRVFEVGQNNLTAFLEATFPGNATMQQAVAAQYPRTGNDTDFDIISEIFTDLTFQCPCAALTAASLSANLTVFRYLFNASFPNTNPVPAIPLGVFHSSEIGLVFGTFPPVNTTAQEFALSQFMQGAWADFAKNPERGPGWAAVGTFPEGVAVLGNEGGSGATLMKGGLAGLDARCEVYQALFAAETV